MANYNIDYRFGPFSEIVRELGEDGYYEREVYTVVCDHGDGHRWLFTGRVYDRDHAERLAASFERRVTADWRPSDEYWDETYPCYGSPAYIAGGGDREFHADLEPEILHFPGSRAAEQAAQRRDWEVRNDPRNR